MSSLRPVAGRGAAVSPVQPGLRSVLTALDVINCFADNQELGVTDVARRVRVAKSTAHRLLTTLAAGGMISKNPMTGRYRLGLALFELSWTAARHDPLRCIALPVLEELRERCGDTAALYVVDGVDVVCLERLESRHTMDLLAGLGCRIPLHASSSGKVFAAYDCELATARIAAGLKGLTPDTTRDPVRFRRVLHETRSQGYGFSADECLVGLSSVSAPVFNSGGDVAAALSIYSPTARLRSATANAARLVSLAARSLSGRLAA